ncbi:phosphohydrolase [Sporanaerobium hydrogeniformans]|uniref:Phosphohydrolase n=1 Tax=Sporanaerobium hydrogeniformans TaxID=3072179 RepID=A0AC61DGJ7_9FIRM|nr:HD domain-containing protein [Sporanaerobium hydrogeniformans]PHV72384.1 phosphohydrolase [Sporanaerobium hydrogeniformans]
MSLISELKPQDTVKGNYLCKYKQLLKNKNGKDYISVRLQDQSGSIDGKIWSIHLGIGAFEVNDVVEVEGEILVYQENLQFNINKITALTEDSYDLRDYIPHSAKDIQILEESLFKHIDSVENPFIKKLLEEVFYDEAIYKEFLVHSAAKSVHHAYISGLLEHSLTVTELGLKMCELYEGVQRDLVLAGCLLHDIGKLQELTAFPQNDYSDEGQLIGHLVLGSELIHDKAKTIPDFPLHLEQLLKHIVLAHHGEYEYASPKRPKCIEAMIVHLADNNDAKLKLLEEMLTSSPEKEGFIGFNKILNRNICKVNL